MTGRVILLNGVSSSGKSTLAEALQHRLVAGGDLWIVMAADDIFTKLPLEFAKVGDHVGPHAELGIYHDEVDGQPTIRLGPAAFALAGAQMASVRAVAKSGVNVIVDDVVQTDLQWMGWQGLLTGLDACWVRVDIEPEIAEERERSRGDRVVGTARSQVDLVHQFVTYDLQVDTGVLDAEAAADAVFAAYTARTPR